MDKIIKFSFILVGLYFSLKGKEYGLWVNSGPGGGFLPMLMGVMLIILSIYSLIKGDSEKFKKQEFLAALKPFGGIILTLVGINLIGFFPAVLIFIPVWLIIVEKYKLQKAVLIDLVTVGVMYGIFSVWLRVPFPSGMIF